MKRMLNIYGYDLSFTPLILSGLADPSTETEISVTANMIKLVVAVFLGIILSLCYKLETKMASHNHTGFSPSSR